MTRIMSDTTTPTTVGREDVAELIADQYGGPEGSIPSRLSFARATRLTFETFCVYSNSSGLGSEV